MKLISSYKVFSDKRLVFELHAGIGTFDRLKAFKLTEAADTNFSHDYDTLIDIRNTTIDGDRKDVESYIEFAIAHGGVSGKRRMAVLTDTPKHVVFFTFMNMCTIGLPQSMKLFSTTEAAISWLGDPLTYNEVNTCLQKLLGEAKAYLIED